MTPNILEQLRKDIERTMGRKIVTPKDFTELSDKIFSREKVYVSSTTLYRIWGYVREKVKPRNYTLDILTRFLGYKNTEDYIEALSRGETVESDPVMSRKIDVENDLNPGDRILLLWHPGRECLVEYQGEKNFIVIESKKTRLCPESTFRCGMIIDGEPLYLDNLRQEGRQPCGYVCGKISGVQYEIIENEED